MKIRPLAASALPWLLMACALVARATDVDRAFGAQEAKADKKLSTGSDLQDAQSRAGAAVTDRARQREAKRAQIAAASTADADTSAKPDAQRKPTLTPAADKSGNVPVVVNEFWTLKGEAKQMVVRCPSGRELGYTFYPKTGRYCTPRMTCSDSQDWIHRALC